jgi:hypothetical protein
MMGSPTDFTGEMIKMQESTNITNNDNNALNMLIVTNAVGTYIFVCNYV